MGRGHFRGVCEARVRLPGQPGAGGRMPCYTVRGLCISTLHVSLIVRVLPRAESATGCIFVSSDSGTGAIYVQGRYFRSIRRAMRASAKGRAEVRRKEAGKQVKHRTCRFFGLLYTALVAIPGISVNWRKPRRTASRPRELRWSGAGLEPAAAGLPLLAAFATIAAMIKCFNSIKIVMIPP